jgi:hypothetical protein
MTATIQSNDDAPLTPRFDGRSIWARLVATDRVRRVLGAPLCAWPPQPAAEKPSQPGRD